LTYRVLFDVSGLVQWYAYLAHPSGIQRVTERILQALPAPDERVEFVARAIGSDHFYHVDAEIIADLGVAIRRPLAIAQLRRLFAASMRLGNLRRMRELRSIHLPYVLLGYTRLGALWQAWCAGSLDRLTMDMRIVSPPSNGDVLVGLGDFWCHRGHVDALIRLRKRSGIRLVHMVHDLFPVDRPDWSHPLYGPEFVGQLNRLMPHVDRWLVNSTFVSRTLGKYLASRGCATSPIEVLTMGSDPRSNASTNVSGDSSVLEKYDLRGQPYILHVGTVEPRKNLIALLDALNDVRRVYRHETPICVLVGRNGWKSEALQHRLKDTDFEKGTVRWIQEVPDVDLPALYRGAQFTVVPSLAEGWGLTVQESLTQGTPCIASATGGLLEAGSDLARYVDPEKPDELRLAIADWIVHDDALEGSRDRIRTRLRARPLFPEWRIAAEQVMKSAVASAEGR
jgi:glycosyltransferase involved in cell wall biosynthesis